MAFTSIEQYDPRSRPTFVEITQKLELLLEKYECIPKASDAVSYKCTLDDAKNGKKPSTQVLANKRYSIDNYCSNWLSNACKSTHNEPDSLHPNDQMHSFIGTNDKPTNDHDHHLRVFDAKKLQHRRSLSENIIPFPPHTTPSDKARCHLINRRNSQLNASSGMD